jgi:hypothetical protein
MAETLQRWWGYLHDNGRIQAKRAHDHTIEGDLDDAFESSFVLYVVEPFWAKSRSHALGHVRIEAEKWLRTQK